MERVKLAALLAKAGRDIESTVVGRSMGLTLPEGTRIRIHAGAPDSVALDTVVAVAVGGSDMLFAHRVVGLTPDYLLTRGDAALLCDEPIERTRVLGVVGECNDGRGWRPVPPPPTERRWISELQRRTILAALAVHVALARGFARLCMRVARVGRLLTRA